MTAAADVEGRAGLTPRITVVLPVRNRPAPLRRALTSVLDQSFADFECIVIDDASEPPVAAVVEHFEDPRLVVVRREVNGGPYAARFSGLRAARGAYILFLDSDWELYPWALAQAVHHLDAQPEVDIVCALHVHDRDSRLFVRVREAPRVVLPAQARLEPPVPDRVAAVRRVVAEGWLNKRPDYFALEAHQFLTAKLDHAQLYVDEPWTRYHADERDRVTSSAEVARRQLDDYCRFLTEHQELVRDPQTNLVLDELLKDAYFALWCARRPEAVEAAAALTARGIRPWRALLQRTRRGIRRRAVLPLRTPVRWA